MSVDWRKKFHQVSLFLYEARPSDISDMRVPAKVYADEEIFTAACLDQSLNQLVNVAMLPGIVGQAIAMPDIHEGYGFPIGGVAATAWPRGAISPGGVGYDINCGVRLLLSDFHFKEIKSKIERLADELMRAIPSGAGRGGRVVLTSSQIDEVLIGGAEWCVKNGLGEKSDLENLEENGRLDGAQPSEVSETAKRRGKNQLGTLGSGNHFLEVQCVEEIFDETASRAFGLFPDQVAVAIHCGSRGLGHQVCTDFVRQMLSKQDEYGYHLPDPELACAPADSPEGRSYLAAMAAAANFAWANRQVIVHHVRGEWLRLFGAESFLGTLYDVCHNMAKIETHEISGVAKRLLVHRKGATRAFAPGRLEIPAIYRSVGQPVFIPGTMGTSSYVLRGTEKAMTETFGTVCHGAGRRLSRHAAKRQVEGDELRKRLEEQGIVVRARSSAGLVEEAPEAYKDVDAVVRVVEAAGLASRVARLRPVAVIKGD